MPAGLPLGVGGGGGDGGVVIGGFGITNFKNGRFWIVYSPLKCRRTKIEYLRMIFFIANYRHMATP